MDGIFEKLSCCIYILIHNKFKLSFTIKNRKKMVNKTDKETQEHKQFYENFLKFTTYSTIVVIAIVALMAIFLV